MKDYLKRYYTDNKEKLNEYRKNDKIQTYQREYQRQYQKNRKQSDPLFKLKSTIRTLIYISFSRGGYTKKSKTFKILGCEFNVLKDHIEQQFEPWMNWENYGKYNGEYNYGWDIDHVIPVSSALNEEELTNLNHYTNLKPLCSKVNRNEKRDDVTHPNSH